MAADWWFGVSSRSPLACPRAEQIFGEVGGKVRQNAGRRVDSTLLEQTRARAPAAAVQSRRMKPREIRCHKLMPQDEHHAEARASRSLHRNTMISIAPKPTLLSSFALIQLFFTRAAVSFAINQYNFPSLASFRRVSANKAWCRSAPTNCCRRTTTASSLTSELSTDTMLSNNARRMTRRPSKRPKCTSRPRMVVHQLVRLNPSTR